MDPNDDNDEPTFSEDGWSDYAHDGAAERWHDRPMNGVKCANCEDEMVEMYGGVCPCGEPMPYTA